MSTVVVRRTERHDPPELPSGEIQLESPPEIPEAAPDSFRQTLMYLPMIAMMVGMGSMFAGNSSNKILYVGGGAMALGMGGKRPGGDRSSVTRASVDIYPVGGTHGIGVYVSAGGPQYSLRC